MVDTPVGFKCPECARQPRSAIVRLRPDRAARAIGAAFAGGLLMGLGIVLLQGVGLFFALIVGWLIGVGMGELVLWASGRYRGRETGWIAIAGCVWTYVVPYGLFYGVDLGDVARNGSLVFVFLGAVIACYVAYQRTQ
jgi:hypothetical protein